VKRLLSSLLVVVLVLMCSSCGNVFVRGAILTSTVNGVVSLVQLSNVPGNGGTTVLITFVTFLQTGTSSTIGFCGDQRSQFPLNQLVQTQFQSGQPCSSLVVVIVIRN